VALKAVSVVERRLEVLLQPERTGETVEQVCRRNGISRDTYYRYRRRYLEEGVDGLEDRSRRPLVSPAQIDADLEITICRMRKDHPRWGARRIQAELARKGVEPPAVSTIHQALRRNHLVAAQPPRRPKALKRFEREISNDLWQMDATQVRLTDRGKVWVMDMLDDHSRYLLAALAAEAPTTEAAWDCFEEAASRYGLPRQVLTDNGMCFTGKLHHVEVAFERNLAELGVELITAGPYHPQTLGKLERFHWTLKQWLADEGPAYDLPHLQELLDAFRHYYNRDRPHQGIGNLTPAERYRWQPPATDAPPSVGYSENGEPVYPPHSIVRKVTRVGNVGYARKLIQVGSRWAGAKVRVIPVGGLIHIYYGEDLVRALAIDPARYSHPLGRRVKRTTTVR
jgi:transposase InsO family protein